MMTVERELLFGSAKKFVTVVGRLNKGQLGVCREAN
jgi:hypothetical protein